MWKVSGDDPKNLLLKDLLKMLHYRQRAPTCSWVMHIGVLFLNGRPGEATEDGPSSGFLLPPFRVSTKSIRKETGICFLLFPFQFGLWWKPSVKSSTTLSNMVWNVLGHRQRFYDCWIFFFKGLSVCLDHKLESRFLNSPVKIQPV